MNAYDLAWVIVLVMMPVAVFALHRATRGRRLGVLRRLLLPVLAVCLVVPAPVPGYPGHLAPAWLVFLLEWGFQAQGEPAGAAAILTGAAGLGLAAGLVWWLVGRRRGAADGQGGTA